MLSTRRVLPALILAMLPVPVIAQSTPGVMVRWVLETSGADAQEMTFYSAQGDAAMTRVEIGSDAIMITNGDARIVLIPEQKMWMDLAEIEAMGASMGMQAAAAGASEDDLPEFVKTGETGTFAGTKCTYYRFTEGESVTDICAASGLGWGMGPSPGGGLMGARGGMPGRGAAGGRGGMGGASAVNSEKYRKLQREFADGFFPLEIKSVQGGNTVHMYATELEKRNLSADLFATEGPEGYEKMSMFGRGRGRGGI